MSVCWCVAAQNTQPIPIYFPMEMADAENGDPTKGDDFKICYDQPIAVVSFVTFLLCMRALLLSRQSGVSIPRLSDDHFVP